MAILCWPPVTNWLFSLWAMSKTGSSSWRHMLAGGRNNEHWTSSKKRENVPPLHCDGVPYVTLVNADEDIMLMLLVIMLSTYFCEICVNFPETVTNHICPLCTGTQWSTISATRIIRCQVPFISSTSHSHPHQSVVQVLRRRQRWQLREWSCRTTWSKSWSTSPSAPSAGRFADKQTVDGLGLGRGN